MPQAGILYIQAVFLMCTSSEEAMLDFSYVVQDPANIYLLVLERCKPFCRVHSTIQIQQGQKENIRNLEKQLIPE